MNPPELPPAATTKPRSTFVTLIAWLTMIAGILGLPISFITILMLLVKSYGTQTSDPIGFVIVVLGPAILLITGFGLLRRYWWARGAGILLLGILIADNAWTLIKGPRPTTTYTSASGVETTVMGSGTNYTSLPVIAICVGLLVKLSSAGVRDDFGAPPRQILAKTDTPVPASDQRHWRVGHHGRDMMYYEENISGTWQRIDIDGEMLMGRAHHVIYFASAERWQSYPEWARDRRAEIIARIKGEFREPDYEYQ